MATTKLTVRIFGGRPLVPLKIILFMGNKTIEEFESQDSFEHSFTGLKGNYNLMITGPNPMGPLGKTRLSIDETEIKLAKDADASPAIRVGKSFMIQYPFKA